MDADRLSEGGQVMGAILVIDAGFSNNLLDLAIDGDEWEQMKMASNAFPGNRIEDYPLYYMDEDYLMAVFGALESERE